MAVQRRAIVLVLGDLGRSPRMINHAASLASHGWAVDLVGYAGAPLPAAVRDHAAIAIHTVSDPSETRARPSSRIPFLVGAGGRAGALGARLLRLLIAGLDRPDLILVQNPPGIPTLPLAWLAARLRSATLVIDWHNLTSAMLALRLGPGHRIVGLAASIERACGRRADHNLFVSEAMATHLRATSGIDGTVFRDRPPAAFRSLDGDARAAARATILADAGVAGDAYDWLIALSPTSWTADEDFDLLLDAVHRIETSTTARASEARRILVLATGRGALRDRFERVAATLPSRRVRLATAWYEANHYPTMVAAADVGLCLHRSSSGLDLPMKVMDFLGAGVPVCALDYGPCLAEAVQDGVTGATFTDATGLARLLERLATDRTVVESLSPGAAAAGQLRWDEAWDRDVLPTLARAWQ
jgi:beta-1,4-mannosyltransferase